MNQDDINQYQKQPAYTPVPPPGNPTYTEAWALVEAARRMAVLIEGGDLNAPENLPKLRDALRLNWRLWTIFQTELSLEDDMVPVEIRESMMNLCNFVDKHTVYTINHPTAENVSTLIEINRHIANGLLTSLHNALDATEAEINKSGDNIEPRAAAETPTSIDTDA